MGILIALIICAAAAAVIIGDAQKGVKRPHRPAVVEMEGSPSVRRFVRVSDDDDGFLRRPLFIEPPDVSMVGFDRPHLRPDPERLIQTEVIVRPRAGLHLFAAARMVFTAAVIGIAIGIALVAAGRVLIALLQRYAGA